jgi:hypothetical protein
MFKSLKLLQNKFSFVSFVVIVIFFISVVIYNQRFILGIAFKADTVQYYSYLPACFIFHDFNYDYQNALNMSNMEYHKEGVLWLMTAPNGKKVAKMTMGASILYSPFFFMGHLFSKCTNQRQDGYSMPYGIFLCIGGVFYGLFGLFILKKILLHYFNDIVTAITLLIVALGTNLFYYSVFLPTRVPVYEFFLFSIFIFGVIKWEKNQSILPVILIGISGGLLTLIRPTDIIIFLFFIFFGVSSINSFKIRYNLFAERSIQILLITIFVLLIQLPQFIYWKYTTDSWIYYSYENEKIFFFKPHIINGLFSYRKGWLLYTPLMIFSLIGIYFLYKNQRQLFFPVLLFILVHTYIIFSWWCWWYGGTYGCRPMIASYTFLSLSLASFLAEWKNKSILKFSSIIGISAFLLLLNLFQAYQYKIGMLHHDSMTKRSYWGIFLKLKKPDDYKNLLQTPDYEKAIAGKEEDIQSVGM